MRYVILSFILFVACISVDAQRAKRASNTDRAKTAAEQVNTLQLERDALEAQLALLKRKQDAAEQLAVARLESLTDKELKALQDDCKRRKDKHATSDPVLDMRHRGKPKEERKRIEAEHSAKYNLLYAEWHRLTDRLEAANETRHKRIEEAATALGLEID